MKMHKQVPCLNFECDEDLAELLELMNLSRVRTVFSCQDHWGEFPEYGMPRTVQVAIMGTAALAQFLTMVGDPAELRDCDSLTERAAPGGRHKKGCTSDHSSGRWRWEMQPHRLRDGTVANADLVFVYFPFTDLNEVTARMRKERYW